MRKEKKVEKVVKITKTADYHDGDFESPKLFTSDRAIKLTQFFTRPDGKPIKGYGIEIETECLGGIGDEIYAEILTRIIFPHFPADLFKVERDGSLTSGSASAEIITQIMTKECVRNLYPAFRAMYNQYFRAFNISASHSGNCGMHVNISCACFGALSKTQEEAIRKFYYIINSDTYFGLMASMVRRTRITDYYRQEPIPKDVCKETDFDNFSNSHYCALNMGHYNQGRIELRLVGGQDSFAAFRNTMETVFHLVEACQKISWSNIDRPEKLFAGCNQYVYDRLTLARRENKITDATLDLIRPTVKQVEYL